MSEFSGAERIAIGSYPYGRYSFDYFLDTAERLGYRKAELWAAAPQIDLMSMTPADAAALGKKLKVHGIAAVAVTPEGVNYPYNIAAREENVRKRSVLFNCRAADLAAELSCPSILMTSGFGYYDEPREEALKRSTDSTAQIASYAAKRGVSVIFETLTPGSSNLINTPEQVAALIDGLPGLPVCGMLDIGQMIVMNQSVQRYTAALGKRFRHVHLHDTGEAVHMALGDGTQDLDRILKEILASGYTGLFSLECNDGRYRKDPRRCDEKNAAWLRKHGWL